MTAHISLISGLCALIERAYSCAFCYRTRVSRQKLEGSGSVEGLHVLASEAIATYSPIPFPYEVLGFCTPGMCPPEGSIVGKIV
jgi:hypothetical protein